MTESSPPGGVVSDQLPDMRTLAGMAANVFDPASLGEVLKRDEVSTTIAIMANRLATFAPDTAPLSETSHAFPPGWHQQLLVTVPQPYAGEWGIVRVIELATGAARMGVVEIHPQSDDIGDAVRFPTLLGWLKPGEATAVGRSAHGSAAFVARAEADGSFSIGHRTHEVRVNVRNSTKGDNNPYDQKWWHLRGSQLRKLSPDGVDAGRPVAAESAQTKPEFTVNGTSFRINGHDPSNPNHWVVTSVNASGQQRQIYVYVSNSDGSLRVSQGYEWNNEKDHSEGVRLLKGAELGPDAQYTQGNQLHPEFETRLTEMIAMLVPGAADPGSRLLSHVNTDAEAKELIRDFANNTETLPLGSKGLDDILRRIPAGHLSKRYIARHFPGQDPDRVIVDHINDINDRLRKENVVPDFTRPIRTYEHGARSAFGSYSTDVYVKNGVEWHMARDSAGRVWIERIRFANSPSTPWGSDAVVPYSGLLTSKPLDYRQNCDALPERLRVKTGNPRLDVVYDDISHKLDWLLPIQLYRHAKGMARVLIA